MYIIYIKLKVEFKVYYKVEKDKFLKYFIL